MSAIAIVDLEKHYGNVRAVDGLSFTVPHGRVTGFLGPNGAGKTTTMRTLLGLTTPDAGSARIEGRPYQELDDPSGTVGAVLDAGGFHDGRSGRAHLRAVATAAGIPRQRVDEVLTHVGLDAPGVAKRRVRGYSLGMRQRLGIATALLGKPRILVLDEPANGLDPAGMRWLRDELRGFAARGGAVLVSSHLLAEIVQVADDVAVVGHGRLLAHAPIDDLVADGASLEDVYLDLTQSTEVPR
ncbi:ABC transporter ATP-binding protein [Egibacter rhizosphaerae]|uniref:ABC transporter ATP-binding protein n=1 Tax=Egibacter rhizosphaerae TaxID=1670831 RepID=UPI00197A8BA3|nr:ATP-binding cassette domain-containing protein [Egibacter rhizosphaerae]